MGNLFPVQKHRGYGRYGLHVRTAREGSRTCTRPAGTAINPHKSRHSFSSNIYGCDSVTSVGSNVHAALKAERDHEGEKLAPRRRTLLITPAWRGTSKSGFGTKLQIGGRDRSSAMCSLPTPPFFRDKGGSLLTLLTVVLLVCCSMHTFFLSLFAVDLCLRLLLVWLLT